MDTSRIQQLIEHGLAALRLAEPPGLAAALAQYVALLEKWNGAYNLTAVRAPEEMVTRHVLDSLVVLPFLDDGPVLDVGTGAGLPGLVLALARPEQQFVLLDASGKKTRFIEHAVDRLGLKNVRVVRARVEDYDQAEGFCRVVSRAFASVGDFIRAAGDQLKPGGRLLAMKGTLPENELAALPAGWRLDSVHRLTVPGLRAERHLLEFCREEAPK